MKIVTLKQNGNLNKNHRKGWTEFIAENTIRNIFNLKKISLCNKSESSSKDQQRGKYAITFYDVWKDGWKSSCVTL